MSADRHDVEAANAALYEALESADVDRMAAVWDDADPGALVCVHPGWPMLRGRAHVLRSFSAIMANTPYIQFFLTDVDVRVTGDTAVVTGPSSRPTCSGDGPLGGGYRCTTAHRSWGPSRSRTMTDRITLTGLRVRGHHGVLPAERREGQQFVVDAVLHLDTRPAAATDALGDTVDYGELASRLAAVVGGEAYDLIETLAGRLADVCLSHPLVIEAEVTVHKPAAPIPLDFQDVSVTVVRP